MGPTSTGIATTAAVTAPRGSGVATLLSWTVVVALLALPLTWGNALGNLAIIVALIAPLTIWDRRRYGEALHMPHLWLLVAAFGLLAIPTLVRSWNEPDALVVFDFFPFVLTMPVAAVLLRSRLRNAPETLGLLAFAGTAAGCLVAAYQVGVMHHERAGGWELSPITFGDLAVILGFMSLGAVIEAGGRWTVLCWAGPILGLSAALASGTRSALLVAAPLLVLALVFVWKTRARGQRLLSGLAIVGGLAVAVGAALALFRVERALDLFRVLSHLLSGEEVATRTAAFRLDQYQAALSAFADAPLIGHGWRHQVESILPYLSEASRQTALKQHWGYVHNDFLNFSVGMGLFGSLAWLLLFLSPPVALIWTRTPLLSARAYMLLTVWIGMTVSGLTDVLFNTELTKMFYCLLPSAILLLGAGERSAVPARNALSIETEAEVRPLAATP